MAVTGMQLSLRAWRHSLYPVVRQKEIAAALGIRADSYSRIERGVMNPGRATKSMLYRLRTDLVFRRLVLGR